jgi:hypothetical protein
MRGGDDRAVGLRSDGDGGEARGHSGAGARRGADRRAVEDVRVLSLPPDGGPSADLYIGKVPAVISTTSPRC